MNDTKQSLFARFDRHPNIFAFLLFTAYVLINNTINATSVWTEANRDGVPDMQLWEPFSWEYTSAVSTLILVPLLVWWFQRFPPRFTHIGRQLLVHLAATLVYAALHVSLMVLMRKGIYQLVGGHYEFGAVGVEFLYEYRKDAWSYVFIFILYQVFQFVYGRLKGEASLIAQQSVEQEGNDNTRQQKLPESPPEHLLVKKLDKEFLVKVSDIDYLESAGNYVNLHSKGRIYPLRGSLSTLTERLQPQGFHRVHRSTSINIHRIDSIEAKPSGDAVVTLNSGLQLNMSRRYREQFKQVVS